MLHFLPTPLKGSLAFLLYVLNTLCLATPLICLSLIKFTLPARKAVVMVDRALIAIATLWIGINSLTTRLFCRVQWEVYGLDTLKKKDWYLVISNHQSWVDILVLQTLLNRKIPMLKFFLKKELIWVPVLGLAWWALDFPFMKRYSKAFLKKHPHLKGKDLESTRKACEKFKHTPVSVMNFVEGTRLTPAKKAGQNSPFDHLLKPRAGGIAFVLGSMGDYLHKILNVTIVYPDKTPSFWEFISGQTQRIVVDFKVIDVEEAVRGDYFNDTQFKAEFCEWLNRLWQEKDQRIRELKKLPLPRH